MVKNLFWIIVGIPVAVLLVAFSVANREPATLALDPFNPADPALAIELPFFVYIFLAILFGLILGGLLVWFSQRRFRQAARREKRRADRIAGELTARKGEGARPEAGSKGRVAVADRTGTGDRAA